MCFSNLPIEFDEDGDPYLADAAEEVSEPGTHTTSAHDCGCPERADALDDADPEEAFADILESVTDAGRSHLTDDTTEAPDAGRERDTAEGD